MVHHKIPPGLPLRKEGTRESTRFGKRDRPEGIIIDTHSEAETRAVGARLGRLARNGDLIGLCGELGTGKTCLVRGLAEALEVPAHKVRSPSFTLINEYGGGRLPLYHVDLYRLAPSE